MFRAHLHHFPAHQSPAQLQVPRGSLDRRRRVDQAPTIGSHDTFHWQYVYRCDYLINVTSPLDGLPPRAGRGSAVVHSAGLPFPSTAGNVVSQNSFLRRVGAGVCQWEELAGALDGDVKQKPLMLPWREMAVPCTCPTLAIECHGFLDLPHEVWLLHRVQHLGPRFLVPVLLILRLQASIPLFPQLLPHVCEPELPH